MDDFVTRRIAVGGRTLELEIPRDSEALLDEEAFAHDEFMPYWAELWPSGVALADCVATARVSGRVLELGCGLGLPALTAALGGAQVLATDWAPDAIALLERNAARVGATLTALHWDWTGDPSALLTPFDLVLAADVLYERRNVPQLLDALPGLAGEVWIADPDRPASAEFFAAASDRWAIDKIAPRVHRLARCQGY